MADSKECAACGGTKRPSPFMLDGANHVLICDDCCDTTKSYRDWATRLLGLIAWRLAALKPEPDTCPHTAWDPLTEHCRDCGADAETLSEAAKAKADPYNPHGRTNEQRLRTERELPERNAEVMSRNVAARARNVAALKAELSRPVTPRYPHEARSERALPRTNGGRRWL